MPDDYVMENVSSIRMIPTAHKGKQYHPYRFDSLLIGVVCKISVWVLSKTSYKLAQRACLTV